MVCILDPRTFPGDVLVWVEAQLSAPENSLPPAVEKWLLIKEISMIGMAQDGPIALSPQGTLNEAESGFDVSKDSSFLRRSDGIANIRENAGGFEWREAMPIAVDEKGNVNTFSHRLGFAHFKGLIPPSEPLGGEPQPQQNQPARGD